MSAKGLADLLNSAPLPSAPACDSQLEPFIVFRTFCSNRRNRQLYAVCLMCHSIRSAHEELHTELRRPPGSLEAEAFEGLVAHIAAAFTPVTVDELVTCSRTKRRPPDDAVALTFDDGYADNLTTALPVLERHSVPATVYATTGFIDRTVAPVEYVLPSLLESQDAAELVVNGKRHAWDLTDENAKRACWRFLYRHLIAARADEREKILASCFAHASVRQETCDWFLDWKGLKTLAASPLITVGAHSVSHPDLTQLRRSAAKEEIEQSQRMLNDHLGHSVTHFAYPYGKRDRSTKRAVRRSGFCSAVLADGGGIDHRSADPFAIPRLEVKDSSFILEANSLCQIQEQLRNRASRQSPAIQ